jgi:hypothetical protein
MGCWRCDQKEQYFREKLNAAIAEARTAARETQTTQVVYKEGSIYKFCSHDTAKKNGYNILQILSKHK